MHLLSVAATNVRCHEFARLECASNITILSGPNGSGKTSMLEAVHTCALARTFVPVSDTSLIRQGADVSRLAVEACSDLGTHYRASVEIRESQRKRISTSHADVTSAKDLIGALPVVALSPDHKAITFGSPADRRSFVDALMAQTSRSVTELLYEHRRLLKQRNAILCSPHPRNEDLLSVLTESFVDVSAKLVEKRRSFLNDLSPVVSAEYSGVAHNNEHVSLRYEPNSVELESQWSVKEQLTRVAASLLPVELKRERTLFGPHKDEVVFVLNNRLVRDHASQGQHKSLLVALKLAEATIMQTRCKERPVVLLDDVFAELDARRATSVLARILEMGLQCLVTTTDGDSVYRHAVDLGATNVVCVDVPREIVVADEFARSAA